MIKSLTNLPKELVFQICSNINGNDILALRLANKHLYDLIGLNDLDKIRAIIDYNDENILKRIDFINKNQISNLKVKCSNRINNCIFNEFKIDREVDILVESIHIQCLHLINSFPNCRKLTIKLFTRDIKELTTREDLIKQITLEDELFTIDLLNLKELEIYFTIESRHPNMKQRFWFQDIITGKMTRSALEEFRLQRKYINDYKLVTEIIEKFRVKSIKKVSLMKYIGDKYSLFNILQGVTLSELKLRNCTQAAFFEFFYKPEKVNAINVDKCQIQNDKHPNEILDFLNLENLKELSLLNAYFSDYLHKLKTKNLQDYQKKLTNLKVFEIDVISIDYSHKSLPEGEFYRNLNEFRISGAIRSQYFICLTNLIKTNDIESSITKVLGDLRFDCSKDANIAVLMDFIDDVTAKLINLKLIKIQITHCYPGDGYCLLRDIYGTDQTLDLQTIKFNKNDVVIRLKFCKHIQTKNLT